MGDNRCSLDNEGQKMARRQSDLGMIIENKQKYKYFLASCLIIIIYYYN